MSLPWGEMLPRLCTNIVEIPSFSRDNAAVVVARGGDQLWGKEFWGQGSKGGGAGNTARPGAPSGKTIFYPNCLL